MTIVYIIGDKDDNVLENLILSQLSETYRVTYIKDKSLVQRGSGYDIIAIESSELLSLSADECIVILKSEGKYEGEATPKNNPANEKGGIPPAKLPPKSIIIVGSENSSQLAALKNSGHIVITCGANEKDTLTFSSRTTKGMVVSLNRELVAFSGRRIQPLEIPIKTNELDNLYYPLAFTALRLVLDDFNSDLGELY